MRGGRSDGGSSCPEECRPSLTPQLTASSRSNRHVGDVHRLHFCSGFKPFPITVKGESPYFSRYPQRKMRRGGLSRDEGASRAAGACPPVLRAGSVMAAGARPRSVVEDSRLGGSSGRTQLAWHRARGRGAGSTRAGQVREGPHKAPWQDLLTLHSRTVPNPHTRWPMTSNVKLQVTPAPEGLVPPAAFKPFQSSMLWNASSTAAWLSTLPGCVPSPILPGLPAAIDVSNGWVRRERGRALTSPPSSSALACQTAPRRSPAAVAGGGECCPGPRRPRTRPVRSEMTHGS